MSSGTQRQLTWDGRGGATFAGRCGAGGDPAGVAVSSEKCVHCGACTSICPSGALSMDVPAWTLAFHPGRCNACGRCVGACPVGAISAITSSSASG